MKNCDDKLHRESQYARPNDRNITRKIVQLGGLAPTHPISTVSD